MTTSILVVSGTKRIDFQRFSISDVVVLCNQQEARVKKDRMGKAFNYYTSETGLIDWLDSLYPDNVVTDLRTYSHVC